MHLVMFDIDGTLTETGKIDEECFVRSLADVCGFADVKTDWSSYKHTTDSGCAVSLTLRPIGRATSTRRIPAFFTRFVWLAPDSLHRWPRFHGFDSTSLIYSRWPPPKVRLHPSQERASCSVTSSAVPSIGFLLLPEVGEILPASKWPAPGCVLTTIRQHRQMMHTIESPL